jgi:diaminohydroxyphosphoribosylaminopyrimidine deaminase / 5-amino-6-(5-phosphoribosylamino)uracil reductase
MDKHLQFMQRAYELAEQSRGKCSPNPFVGAVIVKDDHIIGEGRTQPYGSDHAEVQAIKNCTQNCIGATIYVTLEPCSHYGKTPPCAKAVIESGIRTVYIGIIDPNPLVSGKGIRMLQAAGINVETGLLAAEITGQLEYYITYITQQRPFVILKTAVSLDGRIAAPDGTSRWISCEQSRLATHALRQEADAVVTGIGTVIKDNPLLNVRLDNPYKQPLRVVLDSCLRLPPDSQIAQTANQFKTLVFTADDNTNLELEKALKDIGIEVIRVKSISGKLNLQQVLAELYCRKISLIVLEAGTGLNSSFLKEHFVDKIIMFIAPKLLGGDKHAWLNIGVDNINDSLNLSSMKYRQSGIDLMFTGYPDYKS